MAILSIAKLGNPVLRQQAEALSPRQIASADVQRLIDDMFETMYAAPGIGLAATQVNVHQRLLVMVAVQHEFGAACTQHFAQFRRIDQPAEVVRVLDRWVMNHDHAEQAFAAKRVEDRSKLLDLPAVQPSGRRQRQCRQRG